MRILPWLCFLGTLFTVSAAPQKPNIVFVLADDLGYGEVGFNGQQKILTPYVDQLAREGMVLTHHYCGNAVCAPSRAVLMTGLNPGHAPVRDNDDVGEGEQVPLPAHITTLPGILRQAGYKTAAFGKWGLGSFESTGNPMKQGFDRFLGLTSQWQAHSHYPPAIWDDQQFIPLQNGPKGVPGHAGFPAGADPQNPKAYESFIGKDFSEDHFIQGAEAFIAQHAHEPFCISFASPLPHVSLQIPPEDLKVYEGKFANDPPFAPKAKGSYVPNRTPHATYAAMITRLDKDVGRLMAALEKAGVAQNTIIVFSGDNGATHDVGGVETNFFNSSGGLKGLKGSLYEGGVREPTVVRWPASIPAYSHAHHLSGFEDWLVTFAELAGVSLTVPTNGESLVPTFHGQDRPRQSPLYREFPGYGHQQAIWIENAEGKWKAVRTNMLKTLKATGQVVTELYNLDTDPNETTNLALQNPALVRQLEAQMAASHVPDAHFPLAGVDPLPETTTNRK